MESKSMEKTIIEGKTCRNCGHRSWDRCMLSGYYCTTEREYPSKCGLDFKGWIPKLQRPGLFQRIKLFFYNPSFNGIHKGSNPQNE